LWQQNCFLCFPLFLWLIILRQAQDDGNGKKREKERKEMIFLAKNNGLEGMFALLFLMRTKSR